MNEHMLRIGDKVVVRSDLNVAYYPSETPSGNRLYCNRDMVVHYAGKAGVVIDVLGKDRYALDIDGRRWTWCRAMFSDYTDNPCYATLLFDD